MSTTDALGAVAVVVVVVGGAAIYRFRRLEGKVLEIADYLANRKVRPPMLGWIIEEIEPLVKDWDDKDPKRNLLPDNKRLKLKDTDVSRGLRV